MVLVARMKSWHRWIAFTTLAAFLGFATAVSFHAHPQAGEPAHCSICKVVQQSPALEDRPQPTAQPLLHHTEVVLDSESFVSVVRHTSHGLSPPTL